MRRRWAEATSPRVGLALMALLVVAVVVWRAPLAVSAGADEISPMETRVLGYSEWLTGSTASLRVITSNHDTGAPLRSWVVIRLAPKEKEGQSQVLYRGRTDGRGTLSASFEVPETQMGEFRRFLDQLGYPSVPEEANSAYELFLSGR